MSDSYISRFGNAWEWKDDRNRGALAFRAFDRELTAHASDPFPHSPKAEAFMPSRKIKAPSIISQVQANLSAAENEQHIEFACLSVTKRICQHFLSDAKEIGFPFCGKVPRLALQGQSSSRWLKNAQM
jgi:hypothetical protein